MSDLASRWLLGVAALALPQAAEAQFSVVDIRQVASGEGVRDHPIVATAAAGYVVYWTESLPFGTPEGQVPPSWIKRQRIGFDGVDLGPPDTVAAAGGSHFRPALAVRDGGSWLAWDFREAGMRPGDRDLALTPHGGFFADPQGTLRLTRESAPAPVTTQASPSLLYDSNSGELLLANSWGVFHPARGGTPGGYDSISVEIRAMNPDGTLRHRFTVKGPDEMGEAAHPVLGFLPTGWRERYILAYTSNGGRKHLGRAGHSVYMELFGSDWRVLGGRHMAWPVGGASHPSVASVGGKLYLAWVENATGEIMLSELDQELWPQRPMRLRAALADSDVASIFTLDSPGLGAPMLFDDFGMLGIAFVVTRAWQPAQGRARQEVWMARLGTR